MTQDEIIRMAREAGIKEQRFCVMCSTGNQLEELERFAALVAAHGREACARVCEELRSGYTTLQADIAATQCAAAIRARGEK